MAASWLAVEAGSHRFLFPLSHAGEIFSWTDVQRVPYAQRWFLGVANLRGALSGVVDLAAFIDPSSRAPRTEAALGQCRLVALNPLLGMNCALLVDRLLGLRTIDSFVSSVPAEQGAQPYLGHVYTDLDGGQWQEFNLQALSQHQAFLGISA